MKKIALKMSLLLCAMSILFYCTNYEDVPEVDAQLKALSTSYKDGDSIIYYRGPESVMLPFGSGCYYDLVKHVVMRVLL